MVSPLILKLRAFTVLSKADEDLLTRAITERFRHVPAREDLIREGDEPIAINLIEAGWGSRYKVLEDGRRQIVSLFLPGDICDLNVFLLRQLDHSVGAITPLTVAEISRRDFEELMVDGHPRLRQALWWEQLVSQAIQREWTMNIGQRTAFERLAHLFCEVFIRLRLVGLTHDDHCEFPLTQTELGELTGLSTVHVNRTLQELRALGLVVLKDRTLWIPNLEALQDAALFDPGYLHLHHEGRHLDAND